MSIDFLPPALRRLVLFGVSFYSVCWMFRFAKHPYFKDLSYSLTSLLVAAILFTFIGYRLITKKNIAVFSGGVLGYITGCISYIFKWVFFDLGWSHWKDYVSVHPQSLGKVFLSTIFSYDWIAFSIAMLVLSVFKAPIEEKYPLT